MAKALFIIQNNFIKVKDFFLKYYNIDRTFFFCLQKKKEKTEIRKAHEMLPPILKSCKDPSFLNKFQCKKMINIKNSESNFFFP